jgi:thiamine biosynthesis lipoprotein
MYYDTCVEAKMKKLFIFLMGILWLISGCRQEPQAFNQEFFSMDTIILMTVYTSDQARADQAFAAAEREFRLIHELTDRFAANHSTDPNVSDIYRINQNPGQPIQVSPDTLLLIQTAQEMSRRSQGAFDITIGPLMDLWDFKEDRHVPAQAELDAVLPHVGYEQIRVDSAAGTVTIQPGMVLDLGGVAKGYATDCAANALRQLGIKHAIINAGGNVYALGSKPGGAPWRVGIRHPRQEGALLGIIEAVDQAVVSSGDYERYFETGGQRYHHILDPKTGMPASSAIAVTIVADESIQADLLSTTVFVLGAGAIDDFLPQLTRTEALIVDDRSISMTPGMNHIFALTDEKTIPSP